MAENIYYHIEVKLKNKDECFTEYDLLKSEEDIIKEYITPYLKDDEFFLGTGFVKKSEIKSIVVKKTAIQVDFLVHMLQKTVESGTLFVYTRRSIFTNDYVGRNIVADLIKKINDNMIKTSDKDLIFEKEEKVFISHSAKDKDYVEELVHLLLNFGMDRNKILCTSVSGVQLEVGTPDFLIAIKDYLINSPLFICMFSQNYLDSPICLCEMGAAWITSKEQRLILTPETDYSLAANTIIGKSNGMKINERHRVAELIEQLQKMFNLPQKGMVESSQLIERYMNNLTKRTLVIKESQKNNCKKLSYQNEALEKITSKKVQENIVSEEIKTNRLIQLADDNCIGRFLLRADKKSFLDLLLELTSKDQEKVLNSLEGSYVQDTGFGGYENYITIGRVMFDYIKKSKDKECNEIALNILEGCSRYKSELNELVKDAKIEIILL